MKQNHLLPQVPAHRHGRRVFAALAVVVLGAGCGSAPSPSPSAALGGFEPGTLTLTPGAVAKAVLEDQGLCTKEVGPLAACTPRPGVKKVLAESLQPALKELAALPIKDQPASVFCFLDRRAKVPSYQCVEIYGLQAR